MGGNAMAPFGARRYSREEYGNIKAKIFNAIFSKLPHWRFAEIPYYKDKDSFGDIDILVGSPGSKDYEVLRKTLGVEHFQMNSGVMSCLVEELQVDIIPMPNEDFNTALVYYSFNDLGNLMGKIFHKFGLKYGHRGLTLPLRDGDYEFKELVVSKDFEKIFDFIGLDWTRFVKDFNTLEEIYEYVVGSKYFTPSIFAYENLNHTNRIRDKKRSTYHGFLEYIKDMSERCQFHEDKDSYRTMILEFFPELKGPFNDALNQLEYKRKVRKHYNGNLISEWTGFKGLTLGKFIHYLRHTKGEFETWVMQKTVEELEQYTIEQAIKFDQWQHMSTLDYFSQLKPEIKNAYNIH